MSGGAAEDLIRELARDLDPVDPIPRIRTVTAGVAALWLAAAAIGLAVLGLRPDLVEATLQVRGVAAVFAGLGLGTLPVLGTVLVLVVILGSAMFLLEGPEHGFDSIPHSMYWAIVTMTTVGYGDLVPETTAGRFLAAAVMILGYSIIAVPTGIVTAELTQIGKRPVTTRSCPSCTSEGHLPSARFCRDCGVELPPPSEVEEE